MNADELFDLIRNELNLRHVAYNHQRLREFCEAMHALAFDDDSAAWWADTYVEAMHGEFDGLRASSRN